MSSSPSQKAPWSVRQTLLGIILTMTPWVALALLTSPATGTATHVPDTTTAISAAITSLIIEGSYLLAPIFFAYQGFKGAPDHWRQSLHSLGLRGFQLSNLFIVFGGFLAILAINLLYQQILTALHLNLQTNDQVILKLSRTSPITTYVTLTAAVFVAPICEEIFFRGFVFGGFLNGMSIASVIFLDGLIFGLAHTDLASFAVLFVFGMLLTFIRWRTLSIWPGILLHMLNNGLSAVLIILTMHGISTF